MTILSTSGIAIVIDINSNKMVSSWDKRVDNVNNSKKNKNLSKTKNIKNWLSVKTRFCKDQ